MSFSIGADPHCLTASADGCNHLAADDDHCRQLEANLAPEKKLPNQVFF
jgi:hypothetical protein